MIRKFALWASLTVAVAAGVLLTSASIHRRWSADFDALTEFAEHGRVMPPAGDTLTWARIPLALTPSVSVSSVRSAAS